MDGIAAWQLGNWLIFVMDRYEKFFFGANDKFEVQRGLNNVFAYDLVPSVKVCEAALRACRRGTVPLPVHICQQWNFDHIRMIPLRLVRSDANGSCGLQHVGAHFRSPEGENGE